MKLPKFVIGALRRRVVEYIDSHPPTRIIEGADGEAYLHRWELRGNNPKFDVYLHRFIRSDDARALHDHPAANFSIVLSGTYEEWFGLESRRTRSAGDVIGRRASVAHRIEIDESKAGPVTIFIRGPKLRDWGFYCAGGWRHHKEFHLKGCDP